MNEHKNPGRALRFWLMLLLLVSVAAASVYYAVRTPTPVYLGKTAAEWFRDFQQLNRQWSSLQNPASPATPRRLVFVSRQREPPLDGLRALGTNAALYLGREYLREDGLLAVYYRKLCLKLPSGIQRVLPSPPAARSYVRLEICQALSVLGDDAAPAVPALIKVLRKRDPLSVSTTLQALSRLRFDRRMVDGILEDYSKNGAHTNVLQIVAQLSVRTPVAAGCLARALAMGDAKVRESALYQLRQFGIFAVAILPEITAGLGDPNEEVRYQAACTLEVLGTNAAPAIPALIQATNDPSIMVQRAGARALGAIQGLSAE